MIRSTRTDRKKRPTILSSVEDTGIDTTTHIRAYTIGKLFLESFFLRRARYCPSAIQKNEVVPGFPVFVASCTVFFFLLFHLFFYLPSHLSVGSGALFHSYLSYQSKLCLTLIFTQVYHLRESSPVRRHFGIDAIPIHNIDTRIFYVALRVFIKGG